MRKVSKTRGRKKMEEGRLEEERRWRNNAKGKERKVLTSRKDVKDRGQRRRRMVAEEGG